MQNAVATKAVDIDAGKSALCLVIDPDFVFRQDFSNRLRGAGVDVVEFSSSAHLSESLDDHPPSIAFVAVNALDPFECIRALTALNTAGFDGRVQLIGRCEPLFFTSIIKFGQHLSLTMLPPMGKPVDFNAIRRIVKEQKLVRAPTNAQDLTLTEALAQNWATFWYQPKVALGDKMVIGAEALVRFIHPKHGVIAPGYFLSGSREEDLSELAKLALVHGMKVADEFERRGIAFTIAVNLSAESLLKLPVAELVRKHRPQGGKLVSLVMEVSERQAMSRIPLLKAKADELAACGVSLALDDCGRGSTSLQMLNLIKFSELKIDQSLVRACDTNAANSNLCKTIIQIAHNFSIKTTAVGVETPGEARQLAMHGCDFNQGYLFGKPMNEHQLLDMVVTSRSSAAPATA